MKKVFLARGAAALSLVAACTCGMLGCTASGSNLTGGVAATVNGTEIPEDEITLAIESVRTDKSLTDEASWGAWLAENGYTPESVREEVLDSYINQEVLRQKAADKGVTVDSSEVDTYVDSMKSNYESDEKWQQALSTAGITEDQYRKNIELSLLYQGVYATFATDETPSDEDLLTYAKMYGSYYDGAKRSSHILFDSGDEATAQQVLDQINAGTLDFATAAEQYSKDTGSAANGGDVGWDKLSSFVTEYTTALTDLGEGQVSGLVTSTYGIHIVKCTQVFTAPEEITSIDQLPTEFAEAVTDMVKQANQSQAYQDWLTQSREESDIVINDMPAKVSYNLDMSKYETSSSSSASTSSASESSTDSSSSAESAEGSSSGSESTEGSSSSSASSESSSSSSSSSAEAA